MESEPTPPPLRIAKLDAARRQLETAITLYFQEGDPVSIHTLTAASYDILRPINAVAKGEPMVKDAALIRPEMKKEFLDILNNAQNFFKHGGKDQTATLEFHPHQTEIMLLECCYAYRRISGAHLQLMRVYEMRAYVTFAHTFVTYAIPGNPKEMAYLRELPRRRFFDEGLRMMAHFDANA